MIKFNPEVYIMGKLCKRGHDYEGTGLSVRYKSGTHDCVECHRQYCSENKDKIKEYQKHYQSKTKDNIKEFQKQYHSENKEKHKEYQKQYQSKNISTLSDMYVKKRLKEQTGIPIKEIPQELIEMKRTLISITRMKNQILKEIKNGTN